MFNSFSFGENILVETKPTIRGSFAGSEAAEEQLPEPPCALTSPSRWPRGFRPGRALARDSRAAGTATRGAHLSGGGRGAARGCAGRGGAGRRHLRPPGLPSRARCPGSERQRVSPAALPRGRRAVAWESDGPRDLGSPPSPPFCSTHLCHPGRLRVEVGQGLGTDMKASAPSSFENWNNLELHRTCSLICTWSLEEGICPKLHSELVAEPVI
ncbi:uncharacterized protein [Canis lupus baileyi]|uniref:uncharacterized protein n=1 Tax=Canis lupus baileyi TaxID=143281 RepID=UPI003B96B113